MNVIIGYLLRLLLFGTGIIASNVVFCDLFNAICTLENCYYIVSTLFNFCQCCDMLTFFHDGSSLF